MALPSTGFDTATVTNPGSALTDFTLMVDLSTMSASWWSAVDTADGTKGRAAKSDGTELATDWIAFDNSAKTGWLRVKWTGTLAASGSQVLRIYPPNTANSSNAANATYGQYAAYDASLKGYWPLDESSGTTASDRLNNANGTYSAGCTLGQSAKCGTGVSFNGSSGVVSTSGLDATFASAQLVTISAWMSKTSAAKLAVVGFNQDSNYYYCGILWFTDGKVYCTVASPNDNYPYVALSGSAMHHFVLVFDGTQGTATNRVKLFIDGVAQSLTPSGAGNPTALGTESQLGQFWIGRHLSRWMDGICDDVHLSLAARSADWIAEEYAQTNANATFWGTWTWNASIAVLLDEEDD
jgi:hypothetical protein